MDDLVCTRCGTDEHLRGEPDGNVLRITCSACRASWIRDPSPRCDDCGARDPHRVALPVIEKARGTQLSIVGMRSIYLCRPCEIKRMNAAHRHIPPGHNPAGDQ